VHRRKADWYRSVVHQLLLSLALKALNVNGISNLRWLAKYWQETFGSPESRQLLHDCRPTKNSIRKACNSWMTLKITQGHRNCMFDRPYVTSYYRSVVITSILHRFQNSTRSTVYFTVCDLYGISPTFLSKEN